MILPGKPRPKMSLLLAKSKVIQLHSLKLKVLQYRPTKFMILTHRIHGTIVNLPTWKPIKINRSWIGKYTEKHLAKLPKKNFHLHPRCLLKKNGAPMGPLLFTTIWGVFGPHLRGPKGAWPPGGLGWMKFFFPPIKRIRSRPPFKKRTSCIYLPSALRIIGPSYRGGGMCIAGVWDLQTTSFEIPWFLGW